ncbi:hypothetical protein TWF281_003446 [Arthrobotrys megalospora]
MKFSTSTIVCTALLSSSTALAGTWRQFERRQYYETGVGNAVNAINAAAAAGVPAANTWLNTAPQSDVYSWAAGKRQVTEDQRPRLSAKQRAIERARRHNAPEAQITFLEGIPDETFDKMSTMRRKFGQAMGQLWNGTVPDLNALPTEGFRPPRGAFMRRPGTGGEGRPEGGKPSPREWLMRWAVMSGASAEQVQALKDTPEAEFEGLKDMPLKERLVKEAELMKSDKVEFFKTGVPQALYDELATLETTVREAHKKLRNGEVPTL